MALIIDGYNLLHASGLLPDPRGPATLERAREALLRFLAASLDAREVHRTTVVFDSQAPLYGRPNQQTVHGITVLFASEHDTADELIESLIRAASAPRHLTVVSSDHRIHRAARRRRARAVDSDRWYAEIAARRRRGTTAPAPSKPQDSLSPGEVEFWLAQFAEHRGPAGPRADAEPSENAQTGKSHLG